MKIKKIKQVYLHWADQMALEIKDRVLSNEQVQATVEKQGILVYDEKTPSGSIHVGSGRGWLIHDVVAKALRSLGLKAEFVLSSDDFDPYDKPNAELDEKKYNAYLGAPFCDIPSPVEGYSSFGDYYFKQSTARFKELGIECSFESTADNYRKGLFNPQIKTVLDNYPDVQQVYVDLYGLESEASKKLPFNALCPECGKIATTVAKSWDSEKELLEIECREGVVKWADGCGFKGQVNPYDGGGKFPWKVEWACKWPARGVVVEFGGKDHFSKGGSRTCANKIAVDILKCTPPYPSHGYATGPGYEFFQVGGEKMSTSRGKGLSFCDAVDFFQGNMLRYLLLKSKPNSVVNFDPEKNDIILLTDQYDKMMRIHYGAEEVKDEVRKIQSRLWELVCVASPPSKLPPQIPLILASTVLQTSLSVPAAIAKLKELGHLKDELEEFEVQAVEERLGLAERWLKSFADKQFIFKLVDSNGFSGLDEAQISILGRFIEYMRNESIEKEVKPIHGAIVNFGKLESLESKDLFKTLYLALISKDRGPKLANFILTVGYEKSLSLLEASLVASQSEKSLLKG